MFLKALETNRPLTTRHIQEGQNPLPHCHENVNIHVMWQVLSTAKNNLLGEFLHPISKIAHGQDSALNQCVLFCRVFFGSFNYAVFCGLLLTTLEANIHTVRDWYAMAKLSTKITITA
jgi:hypothetical protein